MPYMRFDSLSDGQLRRTMVPGDTPAKVISVSSLATAGAGAITAAMVIGGCIIRTAAGADRADTLPTAPLIVNALISSNGMAPEVGEAFECLFSQQSGSTYVSTITTATGLTLKSNVNTVAPDITKRLLFICTSKGTNTFSAGVWSNASATFDVWVL